MKITKSYLNSRKVFPSFLGFAKFKSAKYKIDTHHPRNSRNFSPAKCSKIWHSRIRENLSPRKLSSLRYESANWRQKSANKKREPFKKTGPSLSTTMPRSKNSKRTSFIKKINRFECRGVRERAQGAAVTSNRGQLCGGCQTAAEWVTC